MTVKELKKVLEEASEDAEIFISSDTNYDVETGLSDSILHIEGIGEIVGFREKL